MNEEEKRQGTRLALLLLALVWATIIAAVLLALPYCAQARGLQVYLEAEEDLGNGYKLCHYSEGVTITVESHRLCPLSINAGDDE
jgi:hypothetical protein